MRSARRSLTLTLSALLLGTTLGARPQTAASPQPPRLPPDPALTRVDVIVEQPPSKQHPRQLLTTLQPEDFRLFEDDREVRLHSVSGGPEHTARPLALWLVVLCNSGYPASDTSTFLRDKTALLQPALAALQPADRIGVAHWCDTGEAKIDLPPSRDPQKALTAVESILHAPPRPGEDTHGEAAMQQVIGDMLTTTGQMPNSRLPVLLFLYGDHSAAYTSDAEQVIQLLRRSSGIVFGLGDAGSELTAATRLGAVGEVSHLVHHYAAETGGQFLSIADPQMFPSALAYILTQLHTRYVLAFQPAHPDGRAHTLRAELTKAARKTYNDPELRLRSDYIPVPSQTASK